MARLASVSVTVVGTLAVLLFPVPAAGQDSDEFRAMNRPVEPFRIAKTDPRAWVVLDGPLTPDQTISPPSPATS